MCVLRGLKQCVGPCEVGTVENARGLKRDFQWQWGRGRGEERGLQDCLDESILCRVMGTCQTLYLAVGLQPCLCFAVIVLQATVGQVLSAATQQAQGMWARRSAGAQGSD